MRGGGKYRSHALACFVFAALAPIAGGACADCRCRRTFGQARGDAQWKTVVQTRTRESV